MKIGELQDHCGNCKLTNYCTEPFEMPHLCAIEAFKYMDEEAYKKMAESITEEEIQDKLKQYEQNNINPWTDEHNGAICDLILERLYSGISKYAVENEPTYCEILHGKCPEKTDGERTYCNYYCQLYSVYNDFERRSIELQEKDE